MNAPGPSILLVEDNEDDVFVMQRALKLAGITHPLRLAADGQKALDYLAGTGEFADRNSFPLPFILFLDLKLPYLNGFEVMSWIRQQPSLSSVVVVVLTSSPEERDQARAAALGARSFLIKPPTPQMLKDAISSLQNSPARHGL